MLLFVGDPNDLSLAYLSWTAEQAGCEATVLDEEQFGLDWTVELTDDRHDFRVSVGGGVIEDIAGIAVRFNPTADVPDELRLSATESVPFLTERRNAICQWLDNTQAVVVNRPSAGRCNASKPLQMQKLSKFGFDVPPWVATNEQSVALEALAEWEAVIVKSCSGLRSQVRLLGPSTVDRLEASTPVILQRRIAGKDVRVHVVGDVTFATEIESNGIDYRWDDGDNAYSAISIDAELSDLCVAATDTLGLAVSGIDFRVDDNGKWWCLEINPVPTFLPYEASAGHPIGRSIVDLLDPVAHATSPYVSPLYQAAKP